MVAEEKAPSTTGKTVATVGAGGLALWLITKAADPQTWTTINRIAINVWNFGAANFWLVKLLAFLVGVPLFSFIFLYVLGEILKGAYPKERGLAPRWVDGVIRLSRGPEAGMRAIGRLLAKKSATFGLNFDETEPPPAICGWKNETTGATCGDPFILHRGKAASDTDRRKGGFCMVPGCECPGWTP